MFLISVIIKSFAIIFYRNKQTCLKISDRIKNICNSLISQMIIFVYIIIYHVLKKYKNNAYIIKKFESKFIINEWFQFWKKVIILLIFKKLFNSQTTSDTFVKEKNYRVYERCRKNKVRPVKIHSKVDRSKEEEVDKQWWRVYTLFLQRLA